MYKTKLKFHLTSHLQESVHRRRGLNLYYTAIDWSLPTLKTPRLCFRAVTFCNSVTNNKVTPNGNATMFFRKVFEQFTG